ncbi:hypothetical protein [Gordonia sp. CNJ-863]|uniref:hypothetical protein n=1 Tax=Gordonia sp. CNJ-863 TaxID=1904963 RepID=UPI0011152C94|nr:hypothetical protein [Gordonia sp. CNJ-863]
MSRAYRRDRKGRFSASPGSKVTSALDEAEAALQRAEAGVQELAAPRRAQARQRRKTVRRAALTGAALGAVVPAPAAVKVTAARATTYAVASTAAGYKFGKAAGTATASRRAAAGTRVRR